MRLVEAFASIQGESTHAGRPCFFLRLAGCNLRCSYCDTGYAQSAEAGRPAEIPELVELVRNSGLTLVEITALCRALLDAGCEVLIETNGSLSIAPLPAEACRILDCKLPGSGMAEANDYGNYAWLTPRDEVKFVVSSREDFEFACDVIRRYDLAAKTPNLLFSPVWGRVEFADLAAWVVESRLPVRMQLQMHKLIWGDRPGV